MPTPIVYELAGLDVWRDLNHKRVLIGAWGVVDGSEAEVFTLASDQRATWTWAVLDGEERHYALYLRGRRADADDIVLGFGARPTTGLTWALRRAQAPDWLVALALFTDAETFTERMRE
jgi:hypothetical protein